MAEIEFNPLKPLPPISSITDDTDLSDEFQPSDISQASSK